MFDGMKGMMGQFQLMQKLMADENFKAFIAHPKVQAVFKDPEFKEIAKSKNFSKILASPKFAALMQDPELSVLMAKINPQQFIQS
ncbi:MAG: hypothetical protein COT00_00125 [Candidatus Omnitrophica bacterium CG07_land_8_20_14_0_80_50_8]|nr:MAG: hypothetical protein COT00_00125 [Candidatus Omnitrophica bacterium CG07_land_8_20_14_0_80_50_8]